MKWNFLGLAVLLTSSAFAASSSNPQRFIQVEAHSREERSAIADAGMSIEFIRSDSVWGFADPETLRALKTSGKKILGDFDAEIGRGGHDGVSSGVRGFPRGDERFHDYAEMMAHLDALQSSYPSLAKVHVVGRSLEGREIKAIQINTSALDREQGSSSKPGIIFMGNHHAREHLSAEIPLMLAEHLLKNSGSLKSLLDQRDIWILPMVNPDGVEYDISTGSYQSWRKNRRNNGNGTWGVDLNRNYGYQWGTGGSSSNGSSDTYMGPTPFSEPETQVVKSFVEAHLNAKILLSFHTFSELILYPWGHKYQDIETERDLQVFRKMATTMSQWNRYKPQQASDLYIASGDTTDWAYGEHGIFAFTFELSPESIWQGGFYPGARAIDPTFNANLQPCLYLIDLADDPYRALNRQQELKGEFGYLGPRTGAGPAAMGIHPLPQ